MTFAYKKPILCNYYCTKGCPIGQEYIPEVEVKELTQITLEMLASLTSVEKERDRLIEIASDGELTEDEYADFAAIQEKLEKISIATDAMLLWIQNKIAEGVIDPEKLKLHRKQ